VVAHAVLSGEPPESTSLPQQKGELVRIVTGHGGGFGDPLTRPREAVERDLRDGYISLEQARSTYGYGA
jgi:N-methylhydantoinase B